MTLKTSKKIDRVVIVNDSTVARGGASALAMLTAKLLHDRGVPITYFAGDDGDACGILLDAGIDSVGLGGTGLLKSSKVGALVRGLFNVAAYKAMRQWIRKNDTPHTVYHLHGWQQILSPAIFAALRPVSNRTLLHAHDYFLICPNGGQMNYVADAVCKLRPMSIQCIMTNCDKRNYGHKVWRVCRQGIRNLTNNLSNKSVKIAIIQKGMTDAFVRAGVPQSNLISIPNPCVPFTGQRIFAENNKEFQFVGRLVVEKGIRQFLDAARLAGVPARVLGEGPLREELAEKYPEVVFEGWCSRERLSEITRSARMLVMPSLYPEPFGLVLPEAISSGIPVIVSDSALLSPDIVKFGVGFSVDPGDMTAFVNLLKKCALISNEIRAMSVKGFDEPNDFSLRPQQWATKLLATYSNLPGMIG